MYGYTDTPQQAASTYAQYTQQATPYSSNTVNYTTQQPQANGTATAPTQLQSVGTSATQYSNSQQYSYPNAASPYVQYSQPGTAVQQIYGIADFSSDHNTGTNPYTYLNFADYANAFKSVSGNATKYGSKPITGSGLSGGKLGATGGLPKKRFGFGNQKSGGVDGAGAQTFKEHQEGKSHKKKEATAINAYRQRTIIPENYDCRKKPSSATSTEAINERGDKLQKRRGRPPIMRNTFLKNSNGRQTNGCSIFEYQSTSTATSPKIFNDVFNDKFIVDDKKKYTNKRFDESTKDWVKSQLELKYEQEKSMGCRKSKYIAQKLCTFASSKRKRNAANDFFIVTASKEKNVNLQGYLSRHKYHTTHKGGTIDESLPSTSSYHVKEFSKNVLEDEIQPAINEEFLSRTNLSILNLKKLPYFDQLMKYCQLPNNNFASYDKIDDFIRTRTEREPKPPLKEQFCFPSTSSKTHYDKAGVAHCPAFDNYEQFEDECSALRLLPDVSACLSDSRKLLSNIRRTLRGRLFYDSLKRSTSSSTSNSDPDITPPPSQLKCFSDLTLHNELSNVANTKQNVFKCMLEHFNNQRDHDSISPEEDLLLHLDVLETVNNLLYLVEFQVDNKLAGFDSLNAGLITESFTSDLPSFGTSSIISGHRAVNHHIYNSLPETFHSILCPPRDQTRTSIVLGRRKRESSIKDDYNDIPPQDKITETEVDKAAKNILANGSRHPSPIINDKIHLNKKLNAMRNGLEKYFVETFDVFSDILTKIPSGYYDTFRHTLPIEKNKDNLSSFLNPFNSRYSVRSKKLYNPIDSIIMPPSKDTVEELDRYLSNSANAEISRTPTILNKCTSANEITEFTVSSDPNKSANKKTFAEFALMEDLQRMHAESSNNAHIAKTILRQKYGHIKGKATLMHQLWNGCRSDDVQRNYKPHSVVKFAFPKGDARLEVQYLEDRISETHELFAMALTPMKLKINLLNQSIGVVSELGDHSSCWGQNLREDANTLLKIPPAEIDNLYIASDSESDGEHAYKTWNRFRGAKRATIQPRQGIISQNRVIR